MVAKVREETLILAKTLLQPGTVFRTQLLDSLPLDAARGHVLDRTAVPAWQRVVRSRVIGDSWRGRRKAPQI